MLLPNIEQNWSPKFECIHSSMCQNQAEKCRNMRGSQLSQMNRHFAIKQYETGKPGEVQLSIDWKTQRDREEPPRNRKKKSWKILFLSLPLPTTTPEVTSRAKFRRNYVSFFPLFHFYPSPTRFFYDIYSSYPFVRFGRKQFDAKAAHVFPSTPKSALHFRDKKPSTFSWFF